MTISRNAIHFSLVLVTALSAVLWTSPGVAAEKVHETRAVSGPITAVRIIGSIDMSISQGETRGLTLDGNAEEVAKVKVEVNGSEMTLRYDQDASAWFSFGLHRTPKASIAVPELRKVAVVGSGDVAISPFNLSEGKLEIEVTGSGDVNLANLKAKAFAVNIRGSGDVSASGQVATQDIAIAGSGDYGGSDLQSQTTAIAIKGSGDASVWAADALSVSIAGSGDVAYRGQPKLSQAIAGSGEIRQIR